MNAKSLALISVGILTVSAAFADDKSCCAGTASNDMKGKCEATYADLKLTPAQKSKMQKLTAECDKNGCNAQSMAKMEKGARNVLTKEQFAHWKATCSAQMQNKQS